MKEFQLRPDPDDPRLTERVQGVDQEGRAVEASVTVERPLTLFLNGREIVTMMTIADYPEYLAVGYLLNQKISSSQGLASILKTPKLRSSKALVTTSLSSIQVQWYGHRPSLLRLLWARARIAHRVVDILPMLLQTIPTVLLMVNSPL